MNSLKITFILLIILTPMAAQGTLTEGDLRQVEKIVKNENKSLENEIRGEMQRSEKRSEKQLMFQIDALRKEMTGKIDALRKEMTGKIDALRTEMTGKIDALRTEMYALFKGVDRQLQFMTALLVTLIGLILVPQLRERRERKTEAKQKLLIAQLQQKIESDEKIVQLMEERLQRLEEAKKKQENS